MSRFDVSPDARPPSRTRLNLLLATQTVAVAALLWAAGPIYRAIMAAPGQQLADVPSSPFVIIVGLVVFHGAYWHRLRRVPLAVSRHSLISSHLVVFVGRLCFVFGGSMFALVVFRHFPELGGIVDPIRLVTRSLVMLTILFSLFCYALELERIGLALRPPG